MQSLSGVGFARVFHEYHASAWLGPTGFYHTDLRSLPEQSESKTWDSIYVWAAPSYVGETMHLSFQGRSLACRDTVSTASPPPSDRLYLLELLRVPDTVVGGPAVGTVWEIPRLDLFTLTLPSYSTADGLTGYRFAFTITETLPFRGDFDEDGDVDFVDYCDFQVCFGQFELSPRCEAADLNGDGSITLRDFEEFKARMAGP